MPTKAPRTQPPSTGTAFCRARIPAVEDNGGGFIPALRGQCKSNPPTRSAASAAGLLAPGRQLVRHLVDPLEGLLDLEAVFFQSAPVHVGDMDRFRGDAPGCSPGMGQGEAIPARRPPDSAKADAEGHNGQSG